MCQNGIFYTTADGNALKIKWFIFSTQKEKKNVYLGYVCFNVNWIPSVKWMQGKVNSHKENEIRVFGCAMENSPENDF